MHLLKTEALPITVFVCGQLESIALSPDAEDGIGYLGSLQANNLNFTQTQAQASQAPGSSQVLPYAHRVHKHNTTPN